MRIFILFVVTVFLITATLLIFRRVRSDYLLYGKLAPFSGFLEFLIFFLHGAASLYFLESDLSLINMGSFLFPLSLVFMIGGLLLTVVAMSALGLGESVGQQVTGLRQSGLYQYSRNPQIAAYFFVLAGYALLWPSWYGVVWVAIYMFIAHVMVRTEEAHLVRLYGDEYRQFCERTPRYIGIPRQT